MEIGGKQRAFGALVMVVAGCATSFERGAPLEDPASVAREAVEASDVETPTWLWFAWEYADERGSLRGDGVARVNPPDRFRLDLFASEGSLSAVLVEGELTTSGTMEDIELPEASFLYAMAGLFRPGRQPPSTGFMSGEREVLAYGAPGGATRYFFFDAGRLDGLEMRAAGRLERRVELTWESGSRWPVEARYRDDATPNRVRWALDSTRIQAEPFEGRAYEAFPPR